MGSKKKRNASQYIQEDGTRYYKATYILESGAREEEVFISDSMDTARDYAAGSNAQGRVLEGVQEYRQLIDALTS